MFKPFKLIDKTNTFNASTSTAALNVNSRLGPSAKQYKSLIFNGSSQFLSRTPLSTGNRRIWTWSCWIKRSNLTVATNASIFTTNYTTSPSPNGFDLRFTGPDRFYVFSTASGSTQFEFLTTQVFRDPSAWYHIVVSVDTTQTFANDRVKIYVNGIQLTQFDTAIYPTQNNSNIQVNNNVQHFISCLNLDNTTSRFFGGYLSEMYLSDGYAYGPEFFGYFDNLGIWQPKRFAGAYGTNGFYLPLNDSSFSELVKDKSGNSNNWTLNGYSSSTISDVVVSDSPVNNYPTLNPIEYFSSGASSSNVNVGSFSQGNLKFTTNDTGSNLAADNRSITMNLSGKIYFEVKIDYISAGTWSWSSGPAPTMGFGIQNRSTTESLVFQKTYVGACGQGCAVVGLTNDGSYVNQEMPTTGDIMMFAIDVNTGRCWAGKNNIWATGNPSTNTTPTKIFTDLNNLTFILGGRHYSTEMKINFGQRPFFYTPPSGYKSLCTANLPVPTITNGRTAMDAISYIGGNSVYASDSFSGYLKLAMPLNANETIYDISPQLSNNVSTVKVVTNSGVTFPTTSPANTRTYTGSAYFDATGTDRITIPNNNDFKFGTGDFTIECYARFESFPGTTRAIVKCADDGSWNNGWVCGFGNFSNRITFRGGGVYYDGTTTLSTGVWYHLAWTRQNGVVRQFVNGVLDKSDTVTASLDPTASLSIGNDISSNWPINGWMQDLRIYKGVAKYLANFSVPNPMITTESSGATKTISGLNFSPDLVWGKARHTNFWWHILTDSVRGAGRTLSSNSTSAQIGSGSDIITSLNSDGFSLNQSPNASLNQIGGNYIAWAWDRSASKGFDIVNYVGNNTVRTIPHNLGAIPRMIIFKQYNPTPAGGEGNFNVYHASLAANQVVYLDLTSAAVTNNTFTNNTRPTSSVFTVGNDNNNNKTSTDIIAYLWSEIEGYSKFGSYTGNGSTDGPFVYCGFRPRWVMIKRTDAGGTNWNIFDSQRTVSNVAGDYLSANTTNEENISGRLSSVDFTSNGFKIRDSAAYINITSGTYIFAAFAEHPFKYARAR